eukprot:189838-Chlamydomonas_euryale.AAC.8
MVPGIAGCARGAQERRPRVSGGSAGPRGVGAAQGGVKEVSAGCKAGRAPRRFLVTRTHTSAAGQKTPHSAHFFKRVQHTTTVDLFYPSTHPFITMAKEGRCCARARVSAVFASLPASGQPDDVPGMTALTQSRPHILTRC